MRNRLPILLAIALAAAAAIPWLRSLDLRQLSKMGGTTTVPPPAGIGHISPPPAIEAPRGYPGVWADGGAGAVRNYPVPQSIPGERRGPMDTAVVCVESQQSIAAQISEEGELFGHPMVGVGRYYELRQGPIPMIHLELAVQVDSVSTSLLQVCNGTTFWTYCQLPNGESLSKLDAVRAITALEQAAGRMPRDAVAAAPGLGGFGRLLRGLNAQFDFATAQADEVDGTPVWKLTARGGRTPLPACCPTRKMPPPRAVPMIRRDCPAICPTS